MLIIVTNVLLLYVASDLRYGKSNGISKVRHYIYIYNWDKYRKK